MLDYLGVIRNSKPASLARLAGVAARQLLTFLEPVTLCRQTTYVCVVAFPSIKKRLVLIAKLAVFKLLLTTRVRLSRPLEFTAFQIIGKA